MSDISKYRVSAKLAMDVCPASDRYVVAVNGKAVIQSYSNGQSYYMTYKTFYWAKQALARVQVSIPEARIEP